MVRSDEAQTDMRRTAEIKRLGGPIMKSNLRKLVAKREEAEQRIITQAEIAEETGLNPMTVSQWMSFKEFSVIYVKPLTALMRWAGCGMDELISIEEVRPQLAEEEIA